MSRDRKGATLSIGDIVAIRAKVISLELDGVAVCEVIDSTALEPEACSTTLVLNAEQLEIIEWLPNT